MHVAAQMSAGRHRLPTGRPALGRGRPATRHFCRHARCRLLAVQAGDIVIQQGTVHGWVNNGTEPCRVALVMIDAKVPQAWAKGR